MTENAAASLRLFYALWPNDAVRERLQALQLGMHGRLIRYENLHITLAFLGQQPASHLPLLKKILADLPQFTVRLPLDRIGYFKKSRITWAGTHAVPDDLLALQSALAASLATNGIAFDHRVRFVPHVTLARDADPPADRPFDAIDWEAADAALVESSNSGGRLLYRVLAMRDLTHPPSGYTDLV